MDGLVDFNGFVKDYHKRVFSLGFLFRTKKKRVLEVQILSNHNKMVIMETWILNTLALFVLGSAVGQNAYYTTLQSQLNSKYNLSGGAWLLQLMNRRSNMI